VSFANNNIQIVRHDNVMHMWREDRNMVSTALVVFVKVRIDQNQRVFGKYLPTRCVVWIVECDLRYQSLLRTNANDGNNAVAVRVVRWACYQPSGFKSFIRFDRTNELFGILCAFLVTSDLIDCARATQNDRLTK